VRSAKRSPKNEVACTFLFQMSLKQPERPSQMSDRRFGVMATKTSKVASAERSPENELGSLEGWLAFLVVWVACIGMALAIACFMLAPAE
jgi:hypothetical protein